MKTEEIIAAQFLAESILRHEYVSGAITCEELDERLHSVLGVAGRNEQERVLASADGWVDITTMGSPVPQVLATTWHWPGEA